MMAHSGRDGNRNGACFDSNVLRVCVSRIQPEGVSDQDRAMADEIDRFLREAEPER